MRKEMIKALRKCAEEHEKDVSCTGQIIISSLCRDVAKYLEKDLWHYPSKGEYPIQEINGAKVCFNVLIADKGKLYWGTYCEGTINTWVAFPVSDMREQNNIVYAQTVEAWMYVEDLLKEMKE